MSIRPYQYLSEKFFLATERAKEFISKGTSPAQYNSHMDSMLRKLNEQHNHPLKQSDIDKINQNTSSNSWQNEARKMRGAFHSLHNKYVTVLSEEKAIERIEKKAHRRALFYRILTTLGIGFSIMIVYWVAGKLGIKMPLMRMG
jgi:superoxide dismutase